MPNPNGNVQASGVEVRKKTLTTEQKDEAGISSGMMKRVRLKGVEDESYEEFRRGGSRKKRED